MHALSPTDRKTRNPLTHQKHKRQIFLQIIVPILVFFSFLIFLAISIGTSNPENLTSWASISLIFLFFNLMVAGLLIFIPTIVIIYGIYRLLKVIPPNTYNVQQYLMLIKFQTQRVCSIITDPFIRIHTAFAAFRALISRIF